MWSDRTLLDLFAIDVPILQAPMAGASDAELAIAVAKAGGLGALPAGMLSGEQVRAQVAQFRAAAGDRPLNLNFLAHKMPVPNNAREHAWRERLKPYCLEFGIDPAAPVAGAARRPFDAMACAVVEEIKPAVVSFHYGLPEKELVARVKAAGCKIICSATTVEEARFLETNGCEAIIAQGVEAGGHRGMFLSTDPATQVGLFALLPQVVDAVKVPVIATGGIADARTMAAALTLGAAAVQIGTALLFCPEAKILPPHRAALRIAHDDSTVLTNVFSGRLGARAGEPGHPRARACQRHRAGISARQRCVGALACKGSGAGLGRFFSNVRRTGRRPWPRDAGRPTDPRIGCRST